MNIVYFNAEKFYRLAFDYFHYENNLDLAQKYINKALKSNKNHIKSILLKGEICLVKNNLKEAFRLFFNVQKMDSNNNLCLFLIAQTYNKDGNYKLAMEYMNKISFNNIDDTEFLYKCYSLQIDILIKLNQYKKAEKLLKTLDNKLPYDDFYTLEKSFYKMVENVNYFKKNIQNRILHVNF